MAPNDPAAWLFRVVRNRAINAGRAAARRTKHETTIARWNTLRASDPTDEVILKDLLEQLEDRSREIVVLRLWGGLSWQEIADLTTTSRSAAHRIYTEALAQLRRHLEPPICPPINQINRT